jgi:tellurite methyltransferase
VNPKIVRWNEKYRAAADSALAQPDALLVEHRALLIENARALDVACGAGANAIFAAQCGCHVVGVDASLEGLRIAARRAKEKAVALWLLNADLESWRPPPECFDLVLVFRYLGRALLPSLRLSLRPGGVVIYKTFNRNVLEHKPTKNPDYLLAPGELARYFGTFDEIATNDRTSNWEMFSWWVGRRPAP